MSNSVEQAALKSKKKIKTVKCVAVVAAVIVLAWTIYCVATNLNKSERMVVNSFIKAYTETEQPTSYHLLNCSKIYEGQTSEEKDFSYVICDIRDGETGQNYLMIVSGKHEGELYDEQSLAQLDMLEKETVKLEIDERDESMHIGKMQKTLQHYWKFRDVA